jgi:hypothetical protein
MGPGALDIASNAPIDWALNLAPIGGGPYEPTALLLKDRDSKNCFPLKDKRLSAG